jgi:medium-chain acyl-[acyl-carrier-protein] hydrolase
MNTDQPNIPWLVRHRATAPSPLRLFCFPYAGGAAHIYRQWPQSLPASVEVCAVQPPGRGSRIREKPFSDIHSLVAAAAEALRPHMVPPFAFFGHSMGALVSFELARHLRRTGGAGPSHLFVSGSRAPQVPDTGPVIYDLPEAELVEELRRIRGTPAEVLEHAELLQLILPLLRADFSVTQTYRYEDEPPLDCPITVFGGLQDEEVARGSLDAWREQTTAAFSLRMLPGDHFFIHTSHGLLLESLARELRHLSGAVS